MGRGCSKCLDMFRKKEEEPQLKIKETERRLAQIPFNLNSSPQHSKDITLNDKKISHLQLQSYGQKQKYAPFSQKSTLVSTLNGQSRPVSIMYFSSSIIPTTSIHTVLNHNEYYTLIDKVSFVKKTMDCIKVSSIEKQYELNCPMNQIHSTLFLSEGIPIQSIEDVGTQKFIVTNSFPINVSLLLRCHHCKKKIKLTYCKSIIDLSNLKCNHCGNIAKWKIKDISSNFPIWGNGIKLLNHQEIDEAPHILRVMGCIICFKFIECQQMDCGCMICSHCSSDGVQICNICDSNLII